MAKKTVTITVKLSNHKLNINRMRAKAFTRVGDEIVWHCPNARMTVDFNYPGYPSPFTWTSKSIAKGSSTPWVVVNGVGLTKYTLTIHHADYTVVIDPEVDADGGDPGSQSGKKKAAKKKSAKKKSGKKSATKSARKRK